MLRPSLDILLYEGQAAPTQVPPAAPQNTQQQPPAPAPTGGGAIANAVGIGIIVLLAILVLAAIVKLARRKRPPEAGKRAEKPFAAPPPPELPPAQQFKVELPQSEAEMERRRQAEEAHREAEELARKRQELADAAARASAEERARLEAEARALRDKEQEAKREEYRAKKDVEREERERKKREREEAERLAKEAEEAARAEAEAKRQAELAEQQRKVQAQAGRTLAAGLEKTRQQGFMARLNALFGQSREVDESVLAELEETLFTADIGVRTASNLVELAREKAKKNELQSSDKMKSVIRAEIQRIVDLPVPKTVEGGGPPHVVMVVGVNGAGKTTTIGKLAAKLTGQGKKVILAAGDTFRAAATEQLDVWADRAHAELIKGAEGSDPGAVIFDAVKKAKEQNAAVVLADTAGRLHTKAPLMEELKKVKRVMDKALPGAPHEVLLVVDSTMGQNAIQQAKQFHEAVGVTAIALTKLDGTAKGGVVIGISDELKLPVVWVGVGEGVDDLRRFDPKEFVDALFE